MLRRVNEEFSDNTLLVKTAVSWESVFDVSEQAPLRQKLASASLLVARRGKTSLFSKGTGALLGIFYQGQQEGLERRPTGAHAGRAADVPRPLRCSEAICGSKGGSDISF